MTAIESLHGTVPAVCKAEADANREMSRPQSPRAAFSHGGRAVEKADEVVARVRREVDRLTATTDDATALDDRVEWIWNSAEDLLYGGRIDSIRL